MRSNFTIECLTTAKRAVDAGRENVNVVDSLTKQVRKNKSLKGFTKDDNFIQVH